MSLTDLFRSARAACECAEQAKISAKTASAPDEVGARAAKETATVTSQLPEAIAREIDVSQLPPPLPMVLILENLRDLGPGETLLVHHTRRPIHLYPKLDALGCTHETSEPQTGRIEVRITTPTARPA
jgi:hypothetical protein